MKKKTTTLAIHCGNLIRIGSMTVPTQHPDSLPPLVRNISIIGQSPSVDGPPDA